MMSIGYMTDKNPTILDVVAEENLDTTTMMMIEQVLETMGRTKDKAFVVDLLQSHLITSNGDIISLTKEYCREINLPWGLVIALKSRIRSHSIQQDDGWTTTTPSKPKSNEVSISAPHIAKNNKKIESVMRRQDRADDAMSEKASTFGGFQSSSMSDHVGPSSPSGHNDDARVAALLDSHQKNVNAQVDECREFVMHSMDKIMNVLEQRLGDANPPQQVYAANQPAVTVKH
jgi:hypothetical protein